MTREPSATPSSTPGWRVATFTFGAILFVGVVVFGVLPPFTARVLNPTLDPSGLAVGEEARRIHSTLTAADLHSDALLWDRSLLRRGSRGHVDVPRLVEGHVAVQAFTVVTKTPRRMNIQANPADTDNITALAVLQAWPPRTWGSLLERALHQADKLHRSAAASDGALAVIRTREDLRGFLSSRPADERTVAAFLGLEGAHALEGDLSNVGRLWEAGFRMIGFTHFFDNEVGGSAHGMRAGGLTEMGRQVLERMEELGMLVDLAHASPALMDDVLARATRPVIVSHTGVTGTCPNQRNLDDAHMTAVASGGGVIGIGLWETAICGTTPADWARAVRYAADLVGSEHVALGSDWDGAVPAILDASQTVHLVQALLDVGFTEGEIRGILGGNAIRVLLEALPRTGPPAPRAVP